MEDITKMRNKIKEVFNNEIGKEVLNFLKECYVDVSAIDSTAELTYYRLGQKELIQDIIKTVENNEEIKLDIQQ